MTRDCCNVQYPPGTYLTWNLAISLSSIYRRCCRAPCKITKHLDIQEKSQREVILIWVSDGYPPLKLPPGGMERIVGMTLLAVLHFNALVSPMLLLIDWDREKWRHFAKTLFQTISLNEVKPLSLVDIHQLEIGMRQHLYITGHWIKENKWKKTWENSTE